MSDDKHTCTPLESSVEWYKYGRKWKCACGKTYVSQKVVQVEHKPKVRMNKKTRLKLRREKP